MLNDTNNPTTHAEIARAAALTPLVAPASMPAIPAAAMENLATRFRAGGLCLMLLRPDGTVAWHDSSAGTFFTRFVVPLAQSLDGASIRSVMQSLLAGSPVVTWNDRLPEVVMAAFPYIERRHVVGALVLAGKSQSFSLTEDVLRACNRLQLDATWLGQQANELPGYGDEAVTRQARLMLSMVRDQVRLTGLETELQTLSGQLANTYEELSLIYQISGGMRINRGPADFFKQACLDVMEVMGVRGMGVVLDRDHFPMFEPVVYGPVSLKQEQIQKLATDAMALMVQRKAPLLVNDVSRDRAFHWLSGGGVRRLLAVPLQRQEQVLGCLFAVDKAEPFDSVDSKLLNSISNESAIYLENAILFDDVHGLMMGLLHSLTSAVDAKDPYTCGHSERVAMLSKTLALRAGLGEQQAERIYMAGLLHDVGKIGVPESVLQKPGKLTDEEFDQMKKHPVIGARILNDVKQIKDIIPGVLYHHERFDGRGYPNKLAGRDIPVMGRIICLADSFDAMTSTRTYRKALPLDVTLAEFRKCAGTHFDPELAEAFLSIGADGFKDLLQNFDQSHAKLDLTATPAPEAPIAPKEPTT